MAKYITEDNIDFYKELNILLDDNNIENKIINSDLNQICLISGQPLIDNHVILQCKHTFNYIPLFKDLVNHKRKFIYMETNRLKTNEIRCPYCRNRQSILLPYHEKLGVEKVNGINWREPIQLCPPTNSNNSTSSTNSIVKQGIWCWEECPYTHVITFAEDQNDYCYIHLKKMQKQSDIKQKLILKLKLKEEAKQAKLKLLIDSATSENVILSSGMCKQILKTGLRKGQSCGVKTNSNGYCLRHLKMYQPINV